MTRCKVGQMLFIVALFCSMSIAACAEEVTIAGQVLGPDGEPVADAQVLVEYHKAGGVPRLTTDWPSCSEDGLFALSIDVGFREYPIQIAAFKPGYALAWVSVTGEQDRVVTLHLGAHPVSCTGTVTDPEGQPLEGAQVLASMLRRASPEVGGGWDFLRLGEDYPPVTTDAAGRFELGGFPLGVWVGVFAQAEGHAYGGVDEPVPAGASDLEFVLPVGGTISGQVTFNGKPVGGAEVVGESEHPRRGRGLAFSRENGTYDLKHLSAGSYTVYLFRGQEFVARPLTGIHVEPGEHAGAADLEVTPGALISGTVTEAATGEPVPQINIHARAMAYPGGARGASWQIITNQSGAYTVRVPPGEHRVCCMYSPNPDLPQEMAQPAAREIEVAEGDILLGIDFALHRQPDLHGQVLTPEGGPAAGVEVLVPTGYMAGGPEPVFISAEADAAGTFNLSLEEMSSRRPPFLLVARDSQQELAGVVFVDDTREAVELRLGPAAYLVTRAVDHLGSPVTGVGAKVYANHDGRLFCVVVAESDEQGDVILGPLPSNFPLQATSPYNIRDALLDGEWRYLRSLTLAPGELRELPPIRVNLQGRTVRGRVSNEEREAVPGALVIGSGAAEPATANEQGYFELKGLAARGKVLLMAIHPSRLLVAMRELDPGPRVEPDMVLRPVSSATGRVIDQGGRPFRAKVFVAGGTDLPDIKVPFALQARLELASSHFIWTPALDREGRWTVHNLVGGIDYRVTVRLGNEAIGRSQFTVKPGKTVDIGDIVVKPTE